MADLGPAFLLIVAGIGFDCRRRCTLWRMQLEAREWDRALFESTLTGLGLFVAARVLVYFASRADVVLPSLTWLAPVVLLHERAVAILKTILPFAFSGSAVLSYVIGVVVAYAYNRLVPATEATRRMVDEFEDELGTFLYRSYIGGRIVMLSMTDRKVYVGVVLTPPGPLPRQMTLRFLPTISGFRNADNLGVTLTTSYRPVYAGLMSARGEAGQETPKIESFAVVLSRESVVSAREFDDETYSRHFSKDRPEPTSSDPQASA